MKLPDKVYDILKREGLQGPKGEKGPKGDPGATGPQGPKGDTGATGRPVIHLGGVNKTMNVMM